MSVNFIKQANGQFLFTITDGMGELVHSAGMFETQQLASDAADLALITLAAKSPTSLLPTLAAELPTSPQNRYKHIEEILHCTRGMDTADFQNFLTDILYDVVDDSVINELHNMLDLK